MTELAAGIYRLTNGISNFYLIEESGKLVLVDAGAPRDWHLLGQVVGELGRDLSDLDAVLLTHAHSDHIGFAEQARSTTGARVWVHQDDVQMARTGKAGPRDGKTSSYLLRAAFWRTALVLHRRGATKIIPVREVSAFGDGQTLDVPGKPRVVHAPRPHRRQRRAPAGRPRDHVHRRRAMHLERLHRTDRTADHALRPEHRHAAGTRVPGQPERDQGRNAVARPWRAVDRRRRGRDPARPRRRTVMTPSAARWCQGDTARLRSDQRNVCCGHVRK